MKIGFPVLNKAQLNEMCFDTSLHSSEYFGVFCNETQALKVLQTSSLYGSDSGVGLIHFLKNEKIDQIISPECFSMAAKFFNDNGITVFKAKSKSIQENLDYLSSGSLDPFTAGTATQNKKCGESCSSCDSTCDDFDQDVVSI